MTARAVITNGRDPNGLNAKGPVSNRSGSRSGRARGMHPCMSWVPSGRQLRADKLGDADTEVVVHHQDLAARDKTSVGEDVDRVPGEFVEGDDRALSEL